MRIKNPGFKIFITAVILVFAVLLYFSPISCVFLQLTGIPCPGCGMTRALICASRLDFAGAFEYHMMFWSVPVLYLYFLCDGRVFGKKWADVAVLALILAGFIINWII